MNTTELESASRLPPRRVARFRIPSPAMTTRAAGWALALALVACGGDDGGGLHFDATGADGHGGSLADAEADAPTGIADDAGPDAAGGFGGSGGSTEDAGPDGNAEPVEDAGPDALEDAAPDVSDDAEADASDELPEAGPVGPPYDNPNVRCLVKDGNGTTEYRCDGLYAMRWTMRYRGPDGVLHRCTGAPDDRDTHRPACPPGNECRVYPQDEPTLWGECAP